MEEQSILSQENIKAIVFQKLGEQGLEQESCIEKCIEEITQRYRSVLRKPERDQFDADGGFALHGDVKKMRNKGALQRKTIEVLIENGWDEEQANEIYTSVREMCALTLGDKYIASFKDVPRDREWTFSEIRTGGLYDFFSRAGEGGVFENTKQFFRIHTERFQELWGTTPEGTQSIFDNLVDKKSVEYSQKELEYYFGYFLCQKAQSNSFWTLSELRTMKTENPEEGDKRTMKTKEGGSIGSVISKKIVGKNKMQAREDIESFVVKKKLVGRNFFDFTLDEETLNKVFENEKFNPGGGKKTAEKQKENFEEIARNELENLLSKILEERRIWSPYETKFLKGGISHLYPKFKDCNTNKEALELAMETLGDLWKPEFKKLFSEKWFDITGKKKTLETVRKNNEEERKNTLRTFLYERLNDKKHWSLNMITQEGYSQGYSLYEQFKEIEDAVKLEKKLKKFLGRNHWHPVFPTIFERFDAKGGMRANESRKEKSQEERRSVLVKFSEEILPNLERDWVKSDILEFSPEWGSIIYRDIFWNRSEQDEDFKNNCQWVLGQSFGIIGVVRSLFESLDPTGLSKGVETMNAKAISGAQKSTKECFESILKTGEIITPSRFKRLTMGKRVYNKLSEIRNGLSGVNWRDDWFNAVESYFKELLGEDWDQEQYSVVIKKQLIPFAFKSIKETMTEPIVQKNIPVKRGKKEYFVLGKAWGNLSSTDKLLLFLKYVKANSQNYSGLSSQDMITFFANQEDAETGIKLFNNLMWKKANNSLSKTIRIYLEERNKSISHLEDAIKLFDTPTTFQQKGEKVIFLAAGEADAYKQSKGADTSMKIPHPMKRVPERSKKNEEEKTQSVDENIELTKKLAITMNLTERDREDLYIDIRSKGLALSDEMFDYLLEDGGKFIPEEEKWKTLMFDMTVLRFDKWKTTAEALRAILEMNHNCCDGLNGLIKKTAKRLAPTEEDINKFDKKSSVLTISAL
jgi:hypothetical protein